MRTTHRCFPWLGVLLVGFTLNAGCGSNQKQPLVASSAQQASYAARYPDALTATLADFDKEEKEAKEVLEEVSEFTSALKNPDWGQVLEVSDTAVQAGRSQAYFDRIREVRHVQAFFDEEKEELNRRAGSAAQYAADQGGCDVQVGGSVGVALGKAVDRQLEKRLRERNEAHLLIVRYRESLGDVNAKVLAEQADKLSYVSYITYVDLPQKQSRVEEMVGESAKVENAADAFIADEEAFQNAEGRTEGEKAASKARVASMKEVKARVSSSAKEAEKSLQQMRERIEKLQKDFDYFVGAYRAEVQQKIR
ncbi:MAG: hypothetical protein CSA75_02960 [Sorangium cellulosum]|nr:MAG: hypothetical protein CSA75_02960 [Sorangium cellulosum]